MFKKRAQGLSITTIIVAIIALVVIVVLVAIFTGRLGGFGEGLERVGGNAGKNCKEINPNYEFPRTPAQCELIGGYGIVSKDTLNYRGSEEVVCCVPPSG